MKESEKGDQNRHLNSFIEEDDPDERRPDPDDPNEEEGMPNKEMPASDNPHREEIIDSYQIGWNRNFTDSEQLQIVHHNNN